MSNETDKMNYCCDCGWAIRKGFIFKTWYCTCPEIMEKLKKVEISPVNGIKTIEKEKKIECTVLRGQFAYSHLERMPDGRKLCKNYKGQLRGHPAIPPKTTPYHEAPPMPERVAKAMEEHDAAYLMHPSYIICLHQKAKEFQAENRKLRGLITEISEFLLGVAIPGKVHRQRATFQRFRLERKINDQKGNCRCALQGATTGNDTGKAESLLSPKKTRGNGAEIRAGMGAEARTHARAKRGKPEMLHSGSQAGDSGDSQKGDCIHGFG